ncbi:MAG: hypothetical protein JXA97_14145 [Anaerolineales bacterium]|nr:hypothetical protein [Anaerolineales bacterium]
MMDVSQADLKVMKTLGRAHVHANRLDQALEVFAEILTRFPEDVETLIILGDCYLAANQSRLAARLYRQAFQLSPADPDVETRLALVEEESQTVPDGGSLFDAAALDALLVDLTGKGEKVDDEQLEKAAVLLDMITSSDRPAMAVSENLDEIEQLLPALLELNIRQARSDGQSALAADLERLLESFYIQSETDTRKPPWIAGDISRLSHAEWETLDGIEIGILLDPELTEPSRIALAGEALQELGCLVSKFTAPEEVSAFNGQAILIQNPHTSSRLMSMMAQAAASRLPILVDIDTPIPDSIMQPGFAAGGGQNTSEGKYLASALVMASTITTGSIRTMKAFEQMGRQVVYIPHAWSRKNKLWEKPSPKRKSLNIGWMGKAEELENIASIRRAVLRILREFPQTCVVIAENAAAYQLFDSLPESRRMFLPLVDYDDYPYSLAQIDIMLDPVAQSDENLDHSDHRLVEAGIRGIPWIGSPYPAARDWGSGGILADDMEQWHAQLRLLVTDPDTRLKLGRDGQIHAKGREIRKLAPRWLKAFNQAIRANSDL